MKRIWFGAGLLIVLLFLGFICGFVIERSQLSGAAMLEHASGLAAEGDWAAARTALHEAKQLWDRKYFFIAVLCDHEPIEQVQRLYAKLEVFSDERSIVSFRSTCMELARQLEALSRSHSFTLENFF